MAGLGGSIGIRHLNAVLAVALVVMVVGAVRLVWGGRKPAVPEAEALPGRPPAAVEPVRQKEEAWYVGRIAERDIFRPLIPPPPPERGPAPAKTKEPETPRIEELLQPYSLRGIMNGTRPRVVLHDSRNGKVLFLGSGDEIGSSGIRVKSIRASRVVFQFGDQEAEF